MEKYLFVCHANQSRSPTAADVCREMVVAGGLDIVISSAGIKASKDKNQLSELLAQGADKIFVMESIEEVERILR